MELDDLKLALARLDKRYEAQAALDLALTRRAARDRAADGLRPMARRQIGLIVSGAITAFIGVATWHGNGGEGGGMGPFVSGIILHIYGVAMILFGVLLRVLIGGIDWAEPVVAIQRRLTKARRAYVLAGLIIGLTWCVLWMPAMVAGFFLLFGVDIVAPSPSTWLWMGLGGFALMVAVGLVYLWASATRRDAVTGAFDRAFTGGPLGRAQADLVAIGAFERD